MVPCQCQDVGGSRGEDFFPRDLKSYAVSERFHLSRKQKSLEMSYLCKTLPCGLELELLDAAKPKDCFFSGLGPLRIQTSGEDFGPRN